MSSNLNAFADIFKTTSMTLKTNSKVYCNGNANKQSMMNYSRSKQKQEKKRIGQRKNKKRKRSLEEFNLNEPKTRFE